MVRGAVTYAPDIASITDYVTNSDTAAPVDGLVRRCLYAPYDAWHVTNWCLVLRSAIRLDGEYSQRGGTNRNGHRHAHGVCLRPRWGFVRVLFARQWFLCGHRSGWRGRLVAPLHSAGWEFSFLHRSIWSRARGGRLLSSSGPIISSAAFIISPDSGMWPGVLAEATSHDRRWRFVQRGFGFDRLEQPA